MKRTTVMLDEEVYARLKGLAQRKGVTSGRMIREAVAAYVVTETEQLADAEPCPLEPFIGMFEGQDDDMSERMEEYLMQTMGKGLSPGEAHALHR